MLYVCLANEIFSEAYSSSLIFALKCSDLYEIYLSLEQCIFRDMHQFEVASTVKYPDLLAIWSAGTYNQGNSRSATFTGQALEKFIIKGFSYFTESD